MNNDRRNELSDRFATSISHLLRQMYMGLLDDLQGLDMTVTQLRILLLLDEREPQRMGVIASHLGCLLSATTPIVTRLVKRKLLKRASDPQDRRIVLCELSAGGRKVLGRLDRKIRNRALLVTETWDLERLETVIEANRILGGFQ